MRDEPDEDVTFTAEPLPDDVPLADDEAPLVEVDDAPPEEGRRVRTPLVLGIVAFAVLAWFVVLLVGHSQDWRGEGESWAVLETEQWVWVVAAALLALLVAEAVFLFRRLTSRSGEYVGAEGGASDEEPVVTADVERDA